MYCDNCGKEITKEDLRCIRSSREYDLLIKDGGNIGNKLLRDNYICVGCENKVIKLLAKENRQLKR